MPRVVASVAALLVLTSAEDPYGLVGLIDASVDGAVHTLSALPQGGNAVSAFESARGDIVDKLRPVLESSDMLALEGDGKHLHTTSGGIVSGIISKVKRAVENLIDYASTVVQDILDKEIEEIKEKIIDEIAKQVKDILNDIFSGVSQLIEQFWDLIEKTDCAVISGNVDKILEFLDDLGSGCTGLDACCRQIGYDLPVSLRKIASEAPTKLYDLKVCRRLKDISEKSSAEDLAKAFVDTQIATRKFYCANYGSSAARDHFSQEYTNWGSRYFIWSRVISQGCDSTQSCYDSAKHALDAAQEDLPPTLAQRDQVVSAGASLAEALSQPGKCDCYTEEIGADTEQCPGKSCEWVSCSKEGYFAAGFLFTSINGHQGYELTPNGYGISGGPLQCCRPCFTFPDSNLIANSSFSSNLSGPKVFTGCSAGKDCFSEAVSAVLGLRTATLDAAGKGDLMLLQQSVDNATSRGFEDCGCEMYDLGSDTKDCHENCEWAKCPDDDGSFLAGLLFTSLNDHDGFELIPNGYSKSLKSSKCCTSCLQMTPPSLAARPVSSKLQGSADDCGDALACYEAAISLLDTALDEAQAKATQKDLAETLGSIHSMFESSGTWTDTSMENLGSDEGVCHDSCNWAQCKNGALITGQLYTKINDHQGYELTPNGYAPTLSPTKCAVPHFGATRFDIVV